MEFSILNLLENLFNHIFALFSTTRFTINLTSDMPFTFSIWELIIFVFTFSLVCLILSFFLRKD